MEQALKLRWAQIETHGLLASPSLGLGEAVALDTQVVRTQSGEPSIRKDSKESKEYSMWTVGEEQQLHDLMNSGK